MPTRTHRLRWRRGLTITPRPKISGRLRHTPRGHAMPTSSAAAPIRLLSFACAATFVLLGACVDGHSPLQPDERALYAGAADSANVIVVLKDHLAPGGREANRGRAGEMAADLGLQVRHTYGSALFGFAARVPAGRLEALRRDPRIAYVDHDLPVSLPIGVTEPPASSGMATAGHPAAAGMTSGAQITPWGVTRTGGDEAAARGRGISVYVIDTGIHPDHPDLRDNLGDGYNAIPCKGSPKNCPGWADDHGHGTHVAGTIGALDNAFGVVGVSPEVTLHAVKVLASSGRGTTSDVIAGIDWVANHNRDRPRIANMSIAGSGAKVGACTPSGLVGGTGAYYTAICNARNAGVIFVVAAGNAGSDASSTTPAAFYDAVLTVSASACSDIQVNGTTQSCRPGASTFPGFSNWGIQTDPAWPSEGSLPVSIAAPGSGILSTTWDGGFGVKSGTSMAAPHVAGAAALLLQEHPQQANGSAFEAIRNLLLGGAECTETWYNTTGNPHDELFLNARGTGYRECEAPGLAPPTELTATVLSASEVRLTWTHEDAGELQFQLWRSGTLLAVSEAGVTEYHDTGLTPATPYTYYVRAIRGDEVSPWSSRVDVTTLPAGEDPVPVAAFSVNCGNSDVCEFRDESTGAITYRYWDFGQGSTWEGPGSHTFRVGYPSAGSFQASLRVVAGGWGEDTALKTISCTTQGKRVRCAPVD
jgi:subtilisin